jgi:hypothetical protein
MCESLSVLLQVSNFAAADRDAVDQLPMQLIGRFRQPVMNPKSIFPADNQSSLPEICQMTGDRRLGQFQGFMQVADANLAARDEIQEPQSHWIGERLEQLDRGIQPIGSLNLHPHNRI